MTKKMGTIFNTLLKKLTPLLKNKDYLKQGHTFYISHKGNWGLIDFQKNIKDLGPQLSFTINMGICSQVLLEFFDPDKIDNARYPKIENCQLAERLGIVMNGQDKWWSIDETTNLEQLTHEMNELLIKVAIPFINQYITDEALVSLWQSGKAYGMGQSYLQKQLNLAVLLKKFNKMDEVNNIIKQLEQETEGKSTSSFVKVMKRHLLNN